MTRFAGHVAWSGDAEATLNNGLKKFRAARQLQGLPARQSEWKSLWRKLGPD